MLDNDKFVQNLWTLLIANDVPVEETRDSVLYGILKDDFTDEEFGAICVDMAKNDDLFGKYPKPKAFYDRKPKKNLTVIQSQQSNEFLCKIEDYLDRNFVPADVKANFIAELTETEGKVLQSMGGISTLWTSYHRDDYTRSLDSILREAKAKFDEMFEVAIYDSGQLKLTHYNDENVKKIGGVVSGLLKKWGVSDEKK